MKVHLLYLDRQGRVRDDVLSGDRWRARRAGGAARPAPGSSLAAAAFGRDGGVLHVFFLDRTGALRDSTVRGRRWSSRRLPGRARTVEPAARPDLPADLGHGIGEPAQPRRLLPHRQRHPATTSYAPATSTTPRWTASTLGGDGDALLGASAYPDGVQGQQLFYRFGTAVYDNAYTPANGSWYPGLMPGSASQ